VFRPPALALRRVLAGARVLNQERRPAGERDRLHQRLDRAVDQPWQRSARLRTVATSGARATPAATVLATSSAISR